jgi:membrane protease YdiL (CAAX protease family)
VTHIDDPSTTISPVVETDLAPPPRPTWPAWLEILLCSGYPTQIFLGAVLIAAGLSPVRPDDSLSAPFVFVLSLLDTVLLLSLIVFLIVRRGERPLEVFFGGKAVGPELVFGILSVPLVFALVVSLMLTILRFAPELHNVPRNPLENFLGTQTGIWMFLFVAIVAGGVREELQRAFLLHRFKHDLGRPWMGLLITSVAFGMGHTLQGYDAAIITGALGALWGAIYLARGSALAPLVSHSLFNSGELLRILLR